MLFVIYQELLEESHAVDARCCSTANAIGWNILLLSSPSFAALPCYTAGYASHQLQVALILYVFCAMPMAAGRAPSTAREMSRIERKRI